MWGFYYNIVNSYLGDKGIVDSYISQAAIPLINFMTKAPVEFKTKNFNNMGTPLNLMLQFITKIFKDGKELEDELHSMCAVDMIMAMLEHLGDGIQEHIHTINQFYLTELNTVETSHYKNMLIQGIMMNFWYDQQLTLQSLQQHGAVKEVFDFIV